MESSKKILLTTIGIALLIVLASGITFAFFNYTRTGLANNISVGRVYFNTEQNGNINLTNMFPIEATPANLSDNTKVGTVTIDVVGDTTYDNGIEYLVSAVDVQNMVGSSSNEKALPISIDVSYGEASGETIGTLDNSYFTNRGGNSSIYKVLAEDTISGDEDLIVGYINKGANGIDGTITITAYLDKDKILISDTYPSGDVTHIESSGETSIEVTDYTNGTPDSMAIGKTVFTTNEWNSLQTNGVSFKIKVEANEGIWVPIPPVRITYNANGGTITTASKTIAHDATTYGELDEPSPDTGYLFAGWYTAASGGSPVTSTTTFTNGTSATTLYAHYALESSIKCKRVTNAANLHTETCYNACQADVYTLNDTITYGNAKELGSELEVGDAFDCKVSTTGDYTERFYYVSPYYNTNGDTALTFDDLSNNDSYATLIYYSNTKNINQVVTTSNDGVVYYSNSNNNYSGPLSAINNLPTTSVWDNMSLKTNIRAILSENMNTHNSTEARGNFLPTRFSYSGKAARLLTAQEMMRGCGLTQVGNNTRGELNNCRFLYEGTKYANSSNKTNGPWLETPLASSASNVWIADGDYQCAYNYNANTSYIGVRPTIDVPVSALLK